MRRKCAYEMQDMIQSEVALIIYGRAERFEAVFEQLLQRVIALYECGIATSAPITLMSANAMDIL